MPDNIISMHVGGLVNAKVRIKATLRLWAIVAIAMLRRRIESGVWDVLQDGAGRFLAIVCCRDSAGRKRILGGEWAVSARAS